jgi:hypothetical protein
VQITEEERNFDVVFKHLNIKPAVGRRGGVSYIPPSPSYSYFPPEPEFLYFKGARESIPYSVPSPHRFLKIPALIRAQMFMDD